MFKVSNKAPERHQLRFSGVFIVNFEHVLRLFQSVSMVGFEQVNISWIVFPDKYH